MKSTIDGKRRQKGVKNKVKLPIFYNDVYKHLINGTKYGPIGKGVLRVSIKKTREIKNQILKM